MPEHIEPSAVAGIGWEPITEAPERPHNAIFADPNWAQIDTQLRALKVIAALGPERTDATGAKACRALWWTESDGSILWLALSEHHPTWLWLPVDEQNAADVVKRYFGEPEGDEQLCVFSFGLVGDARVLEEELLDQNPFCCSYSIGAPDSDEFGTTHRVTVETLHSRSKVTINAYGGLCTASVRYRPASEGAVVARLNEALDFDFPLDLPVDVIACLHRPTTRSGRQIHAVLGQDLPAGMQITAVLTLELVGAELVADDLAELATSENSELRRAVISVAGRRGFSDLLVGIRERETVPALVAQLDELLQG